jgi:enoyl-CoA hydratase/carnithine racemase
VFFFLFSQKKEPKLQFGLNETVLGIPLPSVPIAIVQYVAMAHPGIVHPTFDGKLLNPDAALKAGMIDQIVEKKEDLLSESINRVLAIGNGAKPHSVVAFAGIKAALQKPFIEPFKDGNFLRDSDKRALEGWFSNGTQQVLKGMVAQLTKK